MNDICIVKTLKGFSRDYYSYSNKDNTITVKRFIFDQDEKKFLPFEFYNMTKDKVKEFFDYKINKENYIVLNN